MLPLHPPLPRRPRPLPRSPPSLTSSRWRPSLRSASPSAVSPPPVPLLRQQPPFPPLLLPNPLPILVSPSIQFWAEEPQSPTFAGEGDRCGGMFGTAGNQGRTGEEIPAARNDTSIDALLVLACKEMRIHPGRRTNTADMDDEGGDGGGGASLLAAKARVVSQVAKKNLIQIAVPIFIELKRLLESKNSPITGCLIELWSASASSSRTTGMSSMQYWRPISSCRRSSSTTCRSTTLPKPSLQWQRLLRTSREWKASVLPSTRQPPEYMPKFLGSWELEGRLHQL